MKQKSQVQSEELIIFVQKYQIKEEDTHTGYYWLGYEWNNLIPACEKCNRAKSNAFPLEPMGIRVKEPPLNRHGELETHLCRVDSPTLLAEKPLLLNPEIDNPELHFVFCPNGEIKAVTERGQKTVEICQLNRLELVLARKEIVDNVIDKIRQLTNDFIQSVINEDTLYYSLKHLFFEILKAQSPDNAYSQLAWFMFKKFEWFFLQPLDIKQQKIVKKAFQLFTGIK